eukprot:9483699-Pyramimonas_sp.AAC.1
MMAVIPRGRGDLGAWVTVAVSSYVMVACMHDDEGMRGARGARITTGTTGSWDELLPLCQLAMPA